MKRFLITVLLAAISCVAARSETPPVDYYTPTGVAPAFFGPNAFPVPDMLDGRTSSVFRLEAYADSYWGNAAEGEDYTSDLFMRLVIPCFTPRVNFVMWGYLAEYCRTGPEANSYRGLGYDGTLKDCYAGDFYISADAMILTQEECGLDVSARMALKTASGHRFHYARYYDSPGYFFDASAGRSFPIADGRAMARLAVSTGFLCWQTDVRRQNDAVMYGAHASVSSGRWELSAEYGGYVGWERHGDAPMTLKTCLSCSFGNLVMKLQHQAGFADWPYHQLRFGAEYRFCFSKDR